MIFSAAMEVIGAIKALVLARALIGKAFDYIF